MFKDRLRQLRIERNLTQAEIAKAIGVSAATIGNYEQGTREPRNNEMWQKLADYFNVSVDELMDKSNISSKRIVKILKSPEQEFIDSLWGYRKDRPIIYNGVDITKLVHAKEGEIISITPEQRRAKIEFSSLSGHLLYARSSLLEILYKLKKASREEIISNLSTIADDIEKNVVYWYKRCWNNIDDIFPKVNNIASLYDLLDVCLILDEEARHIFYLVDIPDDFNWLREKLR